jgi:hypothetical protein
MNPYGVPPPGMPYMERRTSSPRLHHNTLTDRLVALRPDEMESDEQVEGMLESSSIEFGAHSYRFRL